MPQFSLWKQSLKSLESLIVFHSSAQCNFHGIASSLTPTMLSCLYTALTLSTLTSTKTLDDKQSDYSKNEDGVIMMAFVMMTLLRINQKIRLLQHKNQLEEEALIMSALILVRHEAYKRRYIVPRIRRPPELSKAEMFNGCFHESDRIWLKVVCFRSGCFTKLSSKNTD